MIFSSIAMLVSSIGLYFDYGATPVPSSNYSMSFTTLHHSLVQCHLDLYNISNSFVYSLGGTYSYQDGNSTISTDVFPIGLEFFTTDDNNTLTIRYDFGGTFSNLSYVFTCTPYVDDNTVTGYESNPMYEYTQNDLEGDPQSLSIDISSIDFYFDDIHCGVVFDFYISFMDSTYYQNHFSEEVLNDYYTGYQEGYNAGKDAGYQTGLSQSNEESYQNGYNTGYRDGSSDPDSPVYQTGYQNGYESGLAHSSQDFGFMSLFVGIADTPIMMMRSLFGFKIFGTEVLSVVLTLFTALIVIHLVRKVIK